MTTKPCRKILGPDAELHTFTIGLENAPDFKFAREVADHIGSTHHEFTYTLQEGIDVIPQVRKHVLVIRAYDCSNLGKGPWWNKRKRAFTVIV